MVESQTGASDLFYSILQSILGYSKWLFTLCSLEPTELKEGTFGTLVKESETKKSSAHLPTHPLLFFNYRNPAIICEWTGLLLSFLSFLWLKKEEKV